jgi:hypothetical protein
LTQAHGRGIVPLQWPSPKDHAYPSPLQAEASIREDIIFACGMLAAMGLFIFISVHDHSLRAAFVAFVCGVCVVVIVLEAVRVRKTPTLHPAVEMNAHGLKIPELFKEIVPWSEVSQACGHSGLSVVIRDEERCKPTNRRRIATLRHAVACPNSGPLPASMFEWLDVSPDVLFEALQAHRAHFGNGGHSDLSCGRRSLGGLLRVR